MTALHAIRPDDQPEKPSASIVFVTPEMAQRWLSLNKRNRRIKKNAVERYARDMKAGDWEITGEAIKFASDGSLIDGQNRLTAVIVSDQTVPMFVVRGLEVSSQGVMDSGVRRSAADQLTIEGYASSRNLAAAAGVLRDYQDGRLRHCMVPTRGGRANLSHAEIYEIIQENPELVESVEAARAIYKTLPMPSGALAVAHMEFMRIDADDCHRFFQRIADLRTEGAGDPIHTLIKRNGELRGQAGRRIYPSTALFLLFRSWNAYRDYETLRKFQLGVEGRWATMPEPH